MDLIIHKLLSDLGLLMTEFWDALWHREHSSDEERSSVVKPGSSTNPII